MSKLISYLKKKKIS